MVCVCGRISLLWEHQKGSGDLTNYIYKFFIELSKFYSFSHAMGISKLSQSNPPRKRVGMEEELKKQPLIMEFTKKA